MPSQQKPRGTSSNPLKTLIGKVPKTKCQPIHFGPFSAFEGAKPLHEVIKPM
jgi:hypothetical protein